MIIFLFFSCKEEKQESFKSIEKLNDTLISVLRKSLVKERKYDILPLDSLFIKGHSIKIEKDIFDNYWKKPDSISKFIPECGYLENEAEVKRYYYNGVLFFVYGVTVELNEINFVLSNEIIKYSKIEFNKETRLQDLKLIFNESYLSRDTNYEGTIKYDALRLINNENWDFRINLLFENNKLVKLIIWSPC